MGVSFLIGITIRIVALSVAQIIFCRFSCPLSSIGGVMVVFALVGANPYIFDNKLIRRGQNLYANSVYKPERNT